MKEHRGKPDLRDIKSLGRRNSFGVSIEEAKNEFVLPQEGDLHLGAKLKQEVKNPVNRARLKRAVKNHQDRLKSKIEKGLNLFRERSRRIAIPRRYKNAAISISLVVVLAFVCIRGAEAKNDALDLTNQTSVIVEEAFEAIEAGDLAAAVKKAENARNNIKRIKVLAQSWGQDVKYLSLVPNNNSRLVAQEEFLNSVYVILDSFDSLQSNLASSLNSEALISNEDDARLPNVSLLKFQPVMERGFDNIDRDLNRSREGLVKSRGGLSGDLRLQSERAIKAIDQTRQAIVSIQTFVTKGIPWLSGNDGDNRNILFLFQNNTELRGSGGFLGSLALAKFRDGELAEIDFETNIYKLDSDYSRKMQIKPPEELAYSTAWWGLRDSNFAIDFPESMAKVKEFFVNETGEKVDGIAALDTTLFTQLLKVVGPVDMPEYGKVITNENFLQEVQYEVERGYFERPGGKEENEPKKILAEMMPKFLNKLIAACKDRQKLPEILAALGGGLKEKHLIFNFDERTLQKTVEDMGLAGKVEHELSDYLMVHNTNIQGMKSSLNVGEQLKHKVSIEPNGDIKSKLEIVRTHTGNGQWPDGTNKNLIRVLLPEGSLVKSFLPISGNFWPNFEEKNKKAAYYYEGKEAGKTKVTFWQSTETGQTSRSILEYEPNYSVNTVDSNFTYRIKYQKQPGTLGDDVELEVNYPKGFEPANVANYDPINRQILIKFHAKSDREISLKFKRQ